MVNAMNESPDMQAPVTTSTQDNALDELLSALADGELSADELARLMAAGEPLAASWSSYQVIGAALRGGGSAVPARESCVTAVMARLRDEVSPLSVAVAEPARVRGVAANDAVFRWKLVAGLASLAAVGVLTWQVVSQPSPAAGPQLAQLPSAPSPVVATAAPATGDPGANEVVVSGGLGPVIRDPQLDELLAAHRQMGGSALQMPAGFLRNATFETPQR